jgi:poly-gamma-glutamate synthesis protein (capsule biosynthesis protein)
VPYEILPTRLQLLKKEKYQWAMQKLESVSEPLYDYSKILEAWNGLIKHYGISGFRDEIAHIMETFAREPSKGAAMFRNRITTMQHNQHLVDTMTRIMDGSIDHAPAWAFDRVAEWLTRQIPDSQGGID